MTTETLSKTIGIKIPQALMETYEAESERTGIRVAVLVRRDLLRLYASEDATNGSESTRDSRLRPGPRQQGGAKAVKDGQDTRGSSESALRGKNRRRAVA